MSIFTTELHSSVFRVKENFNSYNWMPVWKSKILLFPQILKCCLKGRTVLWEKKKGQTIDTPWIQIWMPGFLFFPVDLANLGHVTASASIQEKKGPYLFGPQLTNFKNEIEKKILQGTLSSQKSCYSYMNYFFTYRLSPLESLLEMGRHYATW